MTSPFPIRVSLWDEIPKVYHPLYFQTIADPRTLTTKELPPLPTKTPMLEVMTTGIQRKTRALSSDFSNLGRQLFRSKSSPAEDRPRPVRPKLRVQTENLTHRRPASLAPLPQQPAKRTHSMPMMQQPVSHSEPSSTHRNEPKKLVWYDELKRWLVADATDVSQHAVPSQRMAQRIPQASPKSGSSGHESLKPPPLFDDESRKRTLRVDAVMKGRTNHDSAWYASKDRSVGSNALAPPPAYTPSTPATDRSRGTTWAEEDDLSFWVQAE